MKAFPGVELEGEGGGEDGEGDEGGGEGGDYRASEWGKTRVKGG